MESVLFALGETPVTVGMVLSGAAAVISTVLVGLLIALVSNSRKRLEEAAQLATDNLRASFIQQVAERDQRIQNLDSRLSEHLRTNANLQAEGAALKAQMTEKDKQNEENLQRFQRARQQMTDEFKVIATEILKSHGETFTKQNREQVDTLLKPLQEKITEFHTGLLKDRAAMGEQIRALAESNLQITTEAHNLTRALKGNSQTQGAWGEMILATILERSGLREGEQFVTQTSHAADAGARVRTDVEILMPNNDRLVIDSKVSLTAFESYTNCEDEDEQRTHLQAHVISMRGHVRTLGEKGYQRHANSGLDYVMMFIPIESALSAAVGADAKLFEYAIDQGVVLTTPTTLMAVLRTVRNVWDIEKRHQNAEEIASRAGLLYDKMAGFVGTMDGLGKSLAKAQQSFDDAKGQLSTGRGNVLGQIEKLRELGAKTTKTLPADWSGETGSGTALQLDAPDDAGGGGEGPMDLN